MSTDMKLIMESWRKNILTEEETLEIKTVGDLKKALLMALKVKKQNLSKSAMKTGAGKIGWELAKTILPGIGAAEAAKDVYDIMRSVYVLPDDKRTNTGLDVLNVDDQISAVLDDRVENQFIKGYLKQFEKVPDSVSLGNMDMTKMLTDFVAEKYKNTKVEKG